MLTEEQRNRLHIPSKEEFSRLYAGEITESSYNAPCHSIETAARAIAFDKNCLRLSINKERKLDPSNKCFLF